MYIKEFIIFINNIIYKVYIGISRFIILKNVHRKYVMSIVSYTLISVDNFIVFSSCFIRINDYETDNSISSHSFRSTGFSRVKALGRYSDAAVFFFFLFSRWL